MSDIGKALAPVRTALLDRARADADAALEQADAAAAAVLAAARAQAEALLHEARAEGRRDAADVRVREAARARREARTTVLRAQQAVYTDLRHRAGTAVRQLRADPCYPALLDRLRGQALAELGPDAKLSEASEGGLVAEVPGRRPDLTLAALAERAVDDLGVQVAALWT